SYEDVTNSVLKYVRALDTSGTTWGASVTLDSVGSEPSLALVNGNTAVSYRSLTTGGLRYTRATDANGTNWGTPLNLDNSVSVGFYSSLVEMNGDPAISYYDSDNDNLKWATVGGPDIGVAQSSALTNEAGSVSLGTVTVGSSGAPITFTITNLGTATLASLAVAKDGTDAANFTVSALSAMSIPTGIGTSTFTVTFSPSSSGSKTAALHITSNVVGAKNPFDIALTGTGQTPTQAFANVMTSAGLTGPDATVLAMPFNDGVENLLKYAFNMNLSGADSRTMGAGGNAGLPAISQQGIWPAGIFRFEFIRRIGSGLNYTPKKSESLTAPSWTPLTDTPTITTIDANWERVLYEEPVDLALVARCFGIVEVTLP
ncbi:MAG: choice-of-anchor D domain-containing protein, partial [Prosthecobacter sp.]